MKKEKVELFRLRTNVKKDIISIEIIMIVAIFLGIISCLIPVNIIKRNINASSGMIESKGDYYNAVPNTYMYSRIDNWTESVFLDILYSVDNERPVTSFVGNWCLNDGTGTERLLKDIKGQYTWEDKIIRPAYWLGYRFFAVLLLLFTDYKSALMINTIAQFILILVCILLMWRLNNIIAAIVMISLLASNCWVCFWKFSGGGYCVDIMVLSTLILLYMSKKKSGNTLDLFRYFMVIGALTCYMDWMTNPLLTLGLPLLAIIYTVPKDYKTAEYINMAWRCITGWGSGYVVMMFFRQAISYLVLGKDALVYFLNRLIDDGGTDLKSTYEVTREIWNTIIRSVNMCHPFRYISLHSGRLSTILICGILILWAVTLIKFHNNVKLYLYTMIGLMPITWLGIFHSLYINHAHIGYHILAITCASILFIMLEIYSLRREIH